MSNLITIKIDGYKRELKIPSIEKGTELQKNNQIDEYLLKYHRCYVISKGMQRKIFSGNYKII